MTEIEQTADEKAEIKAQHTRAFMTGQAFLFVVDAGEHEHVLVEHEVTPGLNYGYVGYCSVCGMAAWEGTAPERPHMQGRAS